MNGVSRVTHGVIKHPLLDRARDEFTKMCLDATDGLAILLLGPTQCGKSIILQEVVRALTQTFKDPRPGAKPIISLQVETVSEGRTKPKWLGIELLKELEHPIYKHIGAFDEDQHYFPSKGRDESTIRIALKEGFSGRFTRRTCLDEVHLLTRTKDPELRGAILESIKSTCAIDRTLIAAGGYEIAYKGLFDSPHFCGRVIPFDFGSYSGDDLEHRRCWARILKTYGEHMELDPPTLLLDHAADLLRVNNGTVGLLDKHLWQSMSQAGVKGKPVDVAILKACAPPEKERAAIALDIQKGREALLPSSGFSPPVDTKATNSAEPTKEQSQDAKPGSGRAPFERSPNRSPGLEVSLHDDN